MKLKKKLLFQFLLHVSLTWRNQVIKNFNKFLCFKLSNLFSGLKTFYGLLLSLKNLAN